LIKDGVGHEPAMRVLQMAKNLQEGKEYILRKFDL
jgi:hypothetical protein